ncbi:MAG: N-acetylmuramic acid 6-phosphate etherase [Fimbriimonadaceae bacterium]|nr:N-acetylmuramic acid 6-phosphate etherase [Fimbriimonadaceae bacterium]
MSTEGRNPRSYGLDKMSAQEIIRLMNEEEYSVLRALQAVEELIAIVSQKAANTFMAGGTVVYVGAGTSGRIATTDAAEMPPTFGVDPNRFVAVVAGGPIVAGGYTQEDAEDDEHAAIDALNALSLTRESIVIGLAASGKTAFTLAAVRHAQQKGIWTCGIANNANGPLLQLADLGIFLDTGPEILTGSTRLKAGTSQKLILNRISTAAMVLSGKVVENLMVDVKAKNEKLRERCVRIVRELAPVTADEADALLAANDWNVRRVLEIVRSNVQAGT